MDPELRGSPRRSSVSNDYGDHHDEKLYDKMLPDQCLQQHHDQSAFLPCTHQTAKDGQLSRCFVPRARTQKNAQRILAWATFWAVGKAKWHVVAILLPLS